MLNGKFFPKYLSGNREAYLRFKPKAYYDLRSCYLAVWKDLENFPIPIRNDREIWKEIFYENTFGAEMCIRDRHRMVSPWRKWVWNLGMIWRKIKWCKSGVNKQKSAVKIIENYWKQYASHINMQKKVGCYIFLHIKRNCEIFIFKCAKIMKIVRIHILIQKNFHVIRLKNEA